MSMQQALPSGGARPPLAVQFCRDTMRLQAQSPGSPAALGLFSCKRNEGGRGGTCGGQYWVSERARPTAASSPAERRPQGGDRTRHRWVGGLLSTSPAIEKLASRQEQPSRRVAPPHLRRRAETRHGQRCKQRHPCSCLHCRRSELREQARGVRDASAGWGALALCGGVP